MADPLFLSLWFPNLQLDDALPRALAVMRQFPFSPALPGISYISVQPVSWSEASVLEQRYNPGIPPEQAVLVAADLLHEDYAYVFEGSWDLWFANEDGQESVQRPVRVKFIVHGPEFDEAVYEQEGHIKIEFGLDSPFLQEEVEMNSEAESRVKSNVKKLVDFTNNLEKNSGTNSRLLWSESEENIAQKLISRLQKVQ
ncbi:MAG TPA: hypothetical protein VH088_22635 [Terriglobales bacterium]|jgi:hypothetical protein|nr:hypothetical protein [Terriglobales bacterium]